jgi:hypothetical protein
VLNFATEPHAFACQAIHKAQKRLPKYESLISMSGKGNCDPSYGLVVKLVFFCE